MSLDEVEALTNRKVLEVEAKRDFGTHRVAGQGADVWLGFEGRGLVTVTTGYINGLTSMRRTPKKDLCTGELEFVVSLEWVEELQGASVYWDDSLVKDNASSGLAFKVLAGEHVLQIEKAGYDPIVERLRLDREDRGDQRIDVTAEELRPVHRDEG